MSAVRIDPETGIFENDVSIFNGLLGRDWQPIKNGGGNVIRENPDTGVIEEDVSVFGGLLGRDWQPQ